MQFGRRAGWASKLSRIIIHLKLQHQSPFQETLRVEENFLKYAILGHTIMCGIPHTPYTIIHLTYLMRKILLLIAAIVINILLYYSVLGPWGYFLFDNFQTINEETAFRDGAITMVFGNLILALPLTLVLSIFIFRSNKYGERFKKLFIPSAIGIQALWFVALLYSGYLNYIGDYPETTPETTNSEIIK